ARDERTVVSGFSSGYRHRLTRGRELLGIVAASGWNLRRLEAAGARRMITDNQVVDSGHDRWVDGAAPNHELRLSHPRRTQWGRREARLAGRALEHSSQGPCVEPDPDRRPDVTRVQPTSFERRERQQGADSA